MEVDNTEFEVYLETPRENFPIQEIYTCLDTNEQGANDC